MNLALEKMPTNETQHIVSRFKLDHNMLWITQNIGLALMPLPTLSFSLF